MTNFFSLCVSVSACLVYVYRMFCAYACQLLVGVRLYKCARLGKRKFDAPHSDLVEVEVMKTTMTSMTDSMD